MDFSLTLRCFAVLLTVISIALIPLVAAPDRPVIHPGEFPPGGLHGPGWPGVLTRFGVVCLLMSFVVLLGLCWLTLRP